MWFYPPLKTHFAVVSISPPASAAPCARKSEAQVCGFGLWWDRKSIYDQVPASPHHTLLTSTSSPFERRAPSTWTARHRKRTGTCSHGHELVDCHWHWDRQATSRPSGPPVAGGSFVRRACRCGHGRNSAPAHRPGPSETCTATRDSRPPGRPSVGSTWKAAPASWRKHVDKLALGFPDQALGCSTQHLYPNFLATRS